MRRLLSALCLALLFSAVMSASRPAAAVTVTDESSVPEDKELRELNKTLAQNGPAAGRLTPYGALLFSGQLGGDTTGSLHPGYRIAVGDDVTVALWGSVEFKETQKVDNKGNIFLPGIGPVKLEGVPYGKLNEIVRQKVSSVYRDGTGVYADVMGTHPMSVFVAGEVKFPGRYGGMATDGLLHFIDKAGGVDEKQGSYRNIEIRRGDRLIVRADLYDFLLDGRLPEVPLQDGDTIFVHTRGKSVAADGMVHRPHRFEFSEDDPDGMLLEELARPDVGATHVSVVGVRDRFPFSRYMARAEFAGFALQEGDRVYFHDAMEERDVRIFVEGTFRGPKVLVVPAGTGLLDVLQQLEVRPGLSDPAGISVERASVADRQQQALSDSLSRLEQSVMYSSASSSEDAKLRGEEMRMVQSFIANAKQVRPSGRIVVSHDGVIRDIMLEDTDRIVVPSVSNIVFVNGEVVMPQAIVHTDGKDAKHYVAKAGGFGRRADTGRVLVRKTNGEVIDADDASIEGGDEIIVLPKVYMNQLQFAKDITDVLYKIAIAASVPAKLLD
jgi:protein involved in polysaccharide export with SLBB domain